jgi:beta-galactosidase/beta-glucuronidase
MVNDSLPRPEYPRPQFVRDNWVNLNGPWSYNFDFSKSGEARGYRHSTGFKDQIIVPFCPESTLSGVGYTDFIEDMWYQRPIDIPNEWRGLQILLHFGAVDFECEAYIDGVSVGRHWGGTVAFTFDITSVVVAGKQHNLVLHVRDDVRSGKQPGGKQCPELKSRGCHYTRTTGIWQTVWMEAVSPLGLQDIVVVPDVDGRQFTVIPIYYGLSSGQQLRVSLLEKGTLIFQDTVKAVNGIPIALPVSRPILWSPDNPFLYDIRFEVLDKVGNLLDTVYSYAGLRKLHIEGNKIYLNNAPFYLRLVLDQGFYPEGIWTAPSDAALKQDIELSLQAGFNGARLHQKVFEPRFHYWADKLGYLTWGESSSWGIDVKDEISARNFLSEWCEIVVRDRNHPSIIAWTPFNETRDTGDGRQHNRLHQDATRLTRSLDPTRPVNDASGYVHVDTDIWTVHTYQQDPVLLREQLTPSKTGGVFRNFPDVEVEYQGQPYIVDEYGGIKWIPSEALVYAKNSWGYGEDPQSLDEFYTRLEALTDVILSLDQIVGFCYTQLTDIEQEQNGIYNYDRSQKFDMERIARILGKPK